MGLFVCFLSPLDPLCGLLSVGFRCVFSLPFALLRGLFVVWWALSCVVGSSLWSFAVLNGLLLLRLGFCCFRVGFCYFVCASTASCELLLLGVGFCCLIWASAASFVRCCGARYGARFILCCAPFGGLLLPRCVVGSSLCGCGLLRLRVASVVSVCVLAALYVLAGVS